MPKAKKKTPLQQVKAEVAAQAVDYIDQLAEENAKETLCNHRNLHAQPEALCVLPKGHAGNHSDGKYDWSDAAGTPPRKHA
jgi:hypothetical protein